MDETVRRWDVFAARDTPCDGCCTRPFFLVTAPQPAGRSVGPPPPTTTQRHQTGRSCQCVSKNSGFGTGNRHGGAGSADGRIGAVARAVRGRLRTWRSDMTTDTRRRGHGARTILALTASAALAVTSCASDDSADDVVDTLPSA